jgi:hypothetical protein
MNSVQTLKATTAYLTITDANLEDMAEQAIQPRVSTANALEVTDWKGDETAPTLTSFDLSMDTVRCAFFDKISQSRMPLVPTFAPLEALAM